MANKLYAGFTKMTRPEQLADAGAVGSIVTFLGLSLSDWNDIVHIVAGVVAIIAGVAAATFHVIKISQIEKQDKG